ncbi:hypothetical protein [Staphylococcus simulans]|uniref:hypothetical protein n=1 Tax=Staphylococcus simulans TaxID=1286 RepID=UPI0039996DAE
MMIIILSLIEVMTISPQLGINATVEMYVVRMVLTAGMAIGLGGYVLYRQLKRPVSESFPLLYVLAFAFWIMVAFWL